MSLRLFRRRPQGVYLGSGDGAALPGPHQRAVRQMDLSARSYHRVLKLARTIADVAGEERIAVQHLAEALQYRPRGLV